MHLLQELWSEVYEDDTKKSKKKTSKKDKSAEKYRTYVAGNMLFNQTCAGELSGTKKIENS